MDKALIICPVGINMVFDDAYDKDNHWRYTKSFRRYETLLVVYNDFVPEPGTYDYIIRKPRSRKWNSLNEICRQFNWQDYDYIGCWDDDYATDIASVNRSIELARQFDFRLFQQSMISWTVYPCLEQNKDWVFSETNFTELGVPFYRNDIFRKVLKFFDDYDKEGLKTTWGMDKVMCAYLQHTAHIIHEVSAKHMRPEVSTYSKELGFKEMEYVMTKWFPRYMRARGIEYIPNDQQNILRAWSK